MSRDRRPSGPRAAVIALVWFVAGVATGFWFGTHSDMCSPTVSATVHRVDGAAAQRLTAGWSR